MPRYIDVTPTWEALLPALVAAAAHDPNGIAMKELIRLARAEDQRKAQATKAVEDL